MVPRSFLYSSVSSPKPHEPGRKQHGLPSKPSFDVLLTQNDDSVLQLPFELGPQSMHTNPVVIPPKRGHRATPATTENPKTPKRNRMTRQSSSSTLNDRLASILQATAIPVPRRGWAAQESRKLPRIVEDFSKLLLGEFDDNTSEGTGNPTLDDLLSPQTEKSFASSDCDSETLSSSVPSISVSSVPSLENDVETPSSISIPFTPSSQRSPSDRILRRRHPSNCENCAYNHPLLDTEPSGSGDEHIVTSQQLSSPPYSTPSKAFISSRSFPRLGSFKSNLTASLRAIKSAAQSVSAFASPSVQPDDFLTRSLFTITPEMTDDRRPLPMDDTPSPALRRYLNPIMVSPAEMYSYQDQPHELLDSRKSPISVQMQTYHRSGTRGSRKRRFRFSSSKNSARTSLSFDPEAPVPLSRQREPRENSDFLRMVVLEMNMRRRGKLRDDVPTRARVWLPPRKGSQVKIIPYDFGEEDEEETLIPTRWIGISVESF
ncbi:hypothetical protein ASPCAL04434 [Aspergillus calidoustus]|uniref:Uncharacterized protein n=1 Tax=Aspergillus calidoustus TaxID=454130 RepID=A0A0U5FY87_ASPCI|nr:hypothetical protein ASPCAL04434 [Aspergillus calidoustus]